MVSVALVHYKHGINLCRTLQRRIRFSRRGVW